MEFSPTYLKEHGTNPINFAKLFIENGYYISLEGFLSNNFVSIQKLMESIGFQKNIYLIHKEIIQNK